MQTIETIYIVSTSAALLASFPQVRQLLITKRSDELSIITWSVWLFSQVVFLAYASTSFARPVLIAANVIWLIFYVVMIILILYYRKRPGSVMQRVRVDDEPSVAEQIS